MIFLNDSKFSIYFSDAKNCCVKSGDKYSLDCLNSIKEICPYKKVLFLKQTHSNLGLVIKYQAQLDALKSFDIEGDFIVTNLKNIGIGVLTADCLPVILFDSHNQVISVVHAGWRGAVTGIVFNALNVMKNEFGTKFENVLVYLGPSAKHCCYKIEKDFILNLNNFSKLSEVISQRDGTLYFDLPFFVYYKLLDYGLNSKNIFKNYNACTICDANFCSYRRDGQLACRQPTIVMLK